MTSSSSSSLQRRSKRTQDRLNPPVAVESVSTGTDESIADTDELRRSKWISKRQNRPVAAQNVSTATAILHIAEKPGVASLIAQALRPDLDFSTTTVTCSSKDKKVKVHRFFFIEPSNPRSKIKVCITSTSGNIMNYVIDAEGANNWDTFDPLDLFDSDYKSVTTDKGLHKFIQREAVRSRIVYLWTDRDREGEVIASDLKTICEEANPQIVVRRVLYTRLHPQAIKAALEVVERSEVDGINQRLCEASRLRSIVDLKTEYAFTRFQKKLLQGTVSDTENANWEEYKALPRKRTNEEGKVQFYATEEDNVPSWGLSQAATFELIYKSAENEDDDVPVSWIIEAFDRRTHTVLRSPPYEEEVCTKQLKTSLETGMDDGTMMATVTSSDMLDAAIVETPSALTTLELYKASFVYLHLGVKETMDTVQVLYNLALVSYPHTTSKGFKDVKLEEILELIVSNNINSECTRYAKVLLKNVAEVVPPPQDDGPHTAICPTGHVHESYHSLSPTEQSMYVLIVRRFLACISGPATVNKRKITVEIGDIKFSAEITLNYENSTFLDVYPDVKYKLGANYAVRDTFKPVLRVIAERGPPKLYNEYDLIEKMSELGIGTAATMHMHIHKVTQEERRLFVKTSDGRFRPTEFASVVWEAFSAAGINCITRMRDRMQEDMRHIEGGFGSVEELLPTHLRFWKARFASLQEHDIALLDDIREKLGCRKRIVADEADDENEVTLGPCKDHPRSRIVIFKRKSSRSREARGRPGYFYNKIGIKCSGFGEKCTSIKVEIRKKDLVFNISKLTTPCPTCSNRSRPMWYADIRMARLGVLGCVQCRHGISDTILKKEEKEKKKTVIEEEGGSRDEEEEGSDDDEEEEEEEGPGDDEEEGSNDEDKEEGLDDVSPSAKRRRRRI